MPRKTNKLGAKNLKSMKNKRTLTVRIVRLQ